MSLKYIVIKIKGGRAPDEELMFLFPNSPLFTHKTMANAITGVKNTTDRDWERPLINGLVVSAGFITTAGECFGRSETLGIQSRPVQDKELYKQLDGVRRI